PCARNNPGARGNFDAMLHPRSSLPAPGARPRLTPSPGSARPTAVFSTSDAPQNIPDLLQRSSIPGPQRLRLRPGTANSQITFVLTHSKTSGTFSKFPSGLSFPKRNVCPDV